MSETTTLRIDDYNALTQSVLTLRADLDDARSVLNRERAEFAEYKRKVRRLAIQAADDEGWCAEGLNSALRELGLEPRMFRYRVRVNVVASQEVDVEVEAEDDDDAHDKAMDLHADDVRPSLNHTRWQYRVDDSSRIDQLGVV